MYFQRKKFYIQYWLQINKKGVCICQNVWNADLSSLGTYSMVTHSDEEGKSVGGRLLSYLIKLGYRAGRNKGLIASIKNSFLEKINNIGINEIH